MLREGLADTGEVPVRGRRADRARAWCADALTVGAMGIVGTAFCIGAQTEAKRIAKARSVGADKLVERLEELLATEPKAQEIAPEIG